MVFTNESLLPVGVSKWGSFTWIPGVGGSRIAAHRRGACSGHGGARTRRKGRSSRPAAQPGLPSGGPSGERSASVREHRGWCAALTLESVPVGAGAGGRRRSLGPDHGREGALLFHCRDDIGR